MTRLNVPVLRWRYYYGGDACRLLLPYVVVTDADPEFAIRFQAGAAFAHRNADRRQARRVIRLLRRYAEAGERDRELRFAQAREAFMVLVAGMLGADVGTTLLAAQRRIMDGKRSAQKRHPASTQRRDAAIRRALADGVPTEVVAGAYGLSVRRVQQIRSAK